MSVAYELTCGCHLLFDMFARGIVSSRKHLQADAIPDAQRRGLLTCALMVQVFKGHPRWQAEAHVHEAVAAAVGFVVHSLFPFQFNFTCM